MAWGASTAGPDAYVVNIIGSGINPRWQLKDNKELKEEIQQLWEYWVPEFQIVH